MSKVRPVCFVAAPIGPEDSDVRRRADRVLNQIIRLALEPAGYVVIRVDKLSTPGLLVLQISELLVRAELVVVDLTGSNANVHYELGIRHAFGKATVQLIEAGESIAFDVAGVRTVMIDSTSDDGRKKAIADLRAAATSAVKGAPTTTSPVASLFELTAVARDLTMFGDDLASNFGDIPEAESRSADHIVGGLASTYQTSKLWKLDFADTLDRSLIDLPSSADIVLTAMLPILQQRAADAPQIAGTRMRLLKSKPHTMPDGTMLPPLRLFYVIEEDTAMILHVEEYGPADV